MKIGKLKQLTLKYAEILKPVSVLDADSTLAGVWVLPSPGLSSSPLGLVAKPRSRRPGLELGTSSCLIFPLRLNSHNSSKSPCVTSVLSILEASNISMPSVKPSPHLARIMCQDVSRCPTSTKNLSRCATSVYNVILFGQTSW